MRFPKLNMKKQAKKLGVFERCVNNMLKNRCFKVIAKVWC